MANETKDVEAKSKQAVGKKRIVLIAVVLVIALGGGATWFMLQANGRRSRPEAETESADKAILHLEGFVVNLADPEENHFLRLGIDLGLDRPLKSAGHGGKAEIPTSRIRDTILSVLTTWRSDALLAPDGKTKLKEELGRALRERIPELGVREVYFTDFLVQR
ncbi:MAG TPA: flagellar basal body-associated FliL family protein [Terriglobia bacterium]|jgi:flagellar FliL protein|nr:flagellar basal body-associated FliL family protein [Terriglobia bacterium]